jgi:hypothetical protein
MAKCYLLFIKEAFMKYRGRDEETASWNPITEHTQLSECQKEKRNTNIFWHLNRQLHLTRRLIKHLWDRVPRRRTVPYCTVFRIRMSWIRIQHLSWIPIRIRFWIRIRIQSFVDQNTKKIYSWKKNLIFIFFIKNTRRTSKPQKKSSAL